MRRVALFVVGAALRGAARAGVPTEPSSLNVDADGDLYGIAAAPAGPDAGTVVFERRPGQTGITVLTTIPASYGYPFGAIPDGKGNIYGVTSKDSGGSFFKFSLGGGLQVLHSYSGAEGEGPQASPMLAKDGNLYGTMTRGGGPSDCGVLYRLTPTGQYAVLHTFADTSDGCSPVTGLVQDNNGWIYGTTSVLSSGGGTVFRYHS